MGLGSPRLVGPSFPDQGSNPGPLHHRADTKQLDHQGSPLSIFLIPISLVTIDIEQFFMYFFFWYSYIFLYKVFRFFACSLVNYEFLHILYIGPLLYVCFSFVDFAMFYLGNLCLHLPLGQEDNLLFCFRSFVICSFHI